MRLDSHFQAKMEMVRFSWYFVLFLTYLFGYE